MVLRPKTRESRSPPGLPTYPTNSTDRTGSRHAPKPITPAGWSSPVARQAHNLKVTGSNPVPATKAKSDLCKVTNPRVFITEGEEKRRRQNRQLLACHSRHGRRSFRSWACRSASEHLSGPLIARAWLKPCRASTAATRASRQGSRHDRRNKRAVSNLWALSLRFRKTSGSPSPRARAAARNARVPAGLRRAATRLRAAPRTDRNPLPSQQP